jgi:hypothetical protein
MGLKRSSTVYIPYSVRPNSLFNIYGFGVLKNVAGPKKQEVEEGWRKWHKQRTYGWSSQRKLFKG